MSTYRTQIVNRQPPALADMGWFADIRFDPDDSLPDYIGLHITNGASQGDLEWKVYKVTYSGSNVTRIQLAYGSWTGRAALFS